MTAFIASVQLARRLKSDWEADNIILKEGQTGYEVDDDNPTIVREKNGDGTTNWNNLPYVTNSSSKITLTKAGTDINTDGNIDTSSDSIPAGRDLLAAYADGQPIFSPLFYSETNDLIYGLTGQEGATTLTFKFI